MKVIFITGGLGFIGSNFAIQEIKAGNKVINLDKVTYAADFENLTEIEKNNNYEFVQGDIKEPKIVAKILNEHKPDYIVNFAAESHVDNSIEKPSEFIETNIIGTYNMLQKTLEYWQNLEKDERRNNFKFLHISTDEVFGSLELEDEKFNEEKAYDPSSPYSASKASSDHLAKAWHRTYGLPVIVTNCSNNYGPRQHREKLIPKVIECCVNEKNIPIYGKGENIRDWIFVEDHCKGIKLALEKGKIGETYCFGGECEKPNNEIVNIICNFMDKIKPRESGHYSELITYTEDRLGHDFRYAVSNNKSSKKLGYKPERTFEDNIKTTIEYYLR